MPFDDQALLPTLRLASSLVFDLIDPQMGLVLAPGSLMIDVLIRNNYTSDSNTMVVGFLRDFSAAERLVGNETAPLRGFQALAFVCMVTIEYQSNMQ
jgi:hypothetical protein